ncbi:HNH endonuclease [Pseudomonas syringae]|uniref:HNH endonuclease n=1 Tax=Pseudomonas syringae TaxID=317 RepID=UPI0009AD8FB5|nr:HNH endonuclease [Pseudomonas syringae]
MIPVVQFKAQGSQQVADFGGGVTLIWLAGTGAVLGAPIPTRFVDQLRGKRFASYDAFRKALWKAVATDPELGSQFNPDNIKRLSKGLSPTTRMKDQLGKRISFELHHLDTIADGGAVYDVDNLRVNTPKNHVDIHRDAH